MRKKGQDYVIGLDFGTDSVRALLVDTADGSELASAVSVYSRWKKGAYSAVTENRFRQHPLDYLESMTEVIREVLEQIPDAAEKVRGLGIDTTGSTPVLATADGTPLAMLPVFADEPDAMFVLWKDHTAITEAAAITQLAKTWGGIDYTRYVGGIYSSEWFWAKALHILKTNPRVARAASTIIEHCDWIPALLTGTNSIENTKRSRCAAGHKALWHASFSPYPASDFLQRLHPDLPALAQSLGSVTWTSDTCAGTLTPEWAKRLGLPETVHIAVGAYDAHMGAVGAGIEAGTFLRIMGTSTCDIMVTPLPASPQEEKLIRGICGQVDGSVIPGMLGLEAGQSAYGDIFAWFKRLLAWPLTKVISHEIADNVSGDKIIQFIQLEDRMIDYLDKAASELTPGVSGVMALDWFNGRRTPDADQSLTGALTGLALGTDAPALYRALVEAAAYGSRAIIDRFQAEGITVERIGAIGGVARKSAFVMQTLADVLNRPIEVRASEQCCALGAAIFGACAAGIFASVTDAMANMASPIERRYEPDSARTPIYNEMYYDYLDLAQYIENHTRLKRGKNKTSPQCISSKN